MKKTFIDISPILRHIKIKDNLLIKKWVDYDHVYSYMKKGEAFYYINGVEYHIKEGQSLIIPAFAPHTVKIPDIDNYVEYGFHFDLYYNEQRAQYSKYYSEMNKIPHLPPKEYVIKSVMPVAEYDDYKALEIEKLFDRLFKIDEINTDYKHLMYKALGTQIIMEHVLNSTNTKNNESKPTWKYVKMAIDLIHENYNDSDLCVSKLSEEVGVSESYLSRLFVEYTGIPVYKYLLRARLEESKKALLNGKYNVSEVAIKVGFDSIHSFSKAFKKHYNMSPTDYIANNSRR